MSLLPFLPIKVGIRSHSCICLFMSLAVWKDIWSVCYGLCKIVSAGMQWKEELTHTSRRSPLIPAQKRGLLKTKEENRLHLLCLSRLYVARIWLKDHVFISASLAWLPARHFFTPLRFSFEEAASKTFNSFMLLYSVHHVVLRKYTYLKYFFSVFLRSPAGFWFYMRLLSLGTSWRHYMGLMAVIGNMP